MSKGVVSASVEARHALQTLWRGGSAAGRSDQELLDRFRSSIIRDEVERVFAILVERHAPMVRRVCLSVLRDEHDADDAVQGTFVVLARKARSVRCDDRESLGPWLSTVAWRVAARLRSERSRRQRHETGAAQVQPTARSGEGLIEVDRNEVLVEEIARLREPYRSAILLCDLDGMTGPEAARVLQCAPGTIKSRRNRAHATLRDRLHRRGFDGLVLAPVLGKLSPIPPATLQVYVRRGLEAASMGAGLRLVAAIVAGAAIVGAIAGGLGHAGTPDSRVKLAWNSDPIPTPLVLTVQEVPQVPEAGAAEAMETGSIRVDVFNADEEPSFETAIVLWKELPPQEEARSFVWDDPSTNRRWEYFRSWYPGYPRPEPFGFSEVPEGSYRVSATTFQEADGGGPLSPTPFDVSAPVEIRPNGIPTIQLRFSTLPEATPRDYYLELHDVASDARVTGGLVRLRRKSDGFPIFRGWGNGAFADRTDENGQILYRNLPTGSYQIEFLGRRATTFGDLEYEPRDSLIEYKHDSPEQHSGPTPGVLQHVRVRGRPLSREEIEARWPYEVRGVVTDDQGRSLPGVKIRASAGMGTLFRTGSATSGPDGAYVLRFSQGMATPVDSMGVNMVVLGVDLPGYFATELAKDPSWVVVSRAPSEAERKGLPAMASEDRIIVARRPTTVDLVLDPAARVTIQVENARGKAVREGWYVSVEPATSDLSNNALPGGEVSTWPPLEFDLPADTFFRFRLSTSHGVEPRRVIRTAPIAFAEPNRYRLNLTIPDEGETAEFKVEP